MSNKIFLAQAPARTEPKAITPAPSPVRPADDALAAAAEALDAASRVPIPAGAWCQGSSDDINDRTGGP